MNRDAFEGGTYRHLNQPRKRRGRPPSAEPRQPVQIWLLPEEHDRLGKLVEMLQALKVTRSQVLGLAIRVLNARLNELRANMEGSGAELPLGIVDLDGLYLLWELEPPIPGGQTKRYHLTLTETEKWTLADMSVLLERAIPVNRSRVAGLAVTNLLQRMVHLEAETWTDIEELGSHLLGPYAAELDVS